MSKFIVQATWDDVPHLTAEDKADMSEHLPQCQKDARIKAVPGVDVIGWQADKAQ